ncbi:MAG: 4Fe-4S dicluster domain-containing protein [Spirochaetales bacterium]|nr:4Fe-4S dicluster domain-containing protein [Spirochaetales bacterium]
MKLITDSITVVIGILLTTGILIFIIRAHREREKQAVRRALFILFIIIAVFSAVFLSPWSNAKLVYGFFLIISILIFIFLLFLPFGRVNIKIEEPKSRYDERDIPFSRFRLKPGSERFNSYYKDKPELLKIDNRIRMLPGLLSIKAREAHPLAFAAATASFQFIKDMRDKVDGLSTQEVPEFKEEASEFSKQELTDWLKKLAVFYGAHSAGITELKDYHIYSNIGRGAGKYGDKIVLLHKYALAFTVEMRNKMVQQGPGAVTVMESAREYANVAHIALQLTHFIRALGYSARSHIDENYRVICPLVARDANLGEIGRLGFLITPDLGPRVRISVVTTDMELVPDKYIPDDSVIDFCNFCLKCADSCPVNAIPTGDREEHRGALKWQIDAVACFKYWNISGTDCGRCMAVCPYSHAPLYSYKPIKYLIKHSGFARRAFLKVDDLFYGKKPKPHKEIYIG